MKKTIVKKTQTENSAKVQNSGRRTTSLEFKKQMENIATSCQFTMDERLKAFRSASEKNNKLKS